MKIHGNPTLFFFIFSNVICFIVVCTALSVRLTTSINFYKDNFLVGYKKGMIQYKNMYYIICTFLVGYETKRRGYKKRVLRLFQIHITTCLEHLPINKIPQPSFLYIFTGLKPYSPTVKCMAPPSPPNECPLLCVVS